MGRKIKPWAATHYFEKQTMYGKETVYIKDALFCWMYWDDVWFDWYRWDSSQGTPIPLKD